MLFRTGPEILLVKEKNDGGRWSLPGGWADVGYTPFEVAAKEAQEKAGLLVDPVRLLALVDKRKHSLAPTLSFTAGKSYRLTFALKETATGSD